MADAYLLMDARELRRQIRGLEATSADEDRKESHLAALRRERDALLHRAQAAEARGDQRPVQLDQWSTTGFGEGKSGTEEAAEFRAAAENVGREIERVEKDWPVVRSEKGYTEPEALKSRAGAAHGNAAPAPDRLRGLRRVVDVDVAVHDVEDHRCRRAHEGGFGPPRGKGTSVPVTFSTGKAGVSDEHADEETRGGGV
jgi:hypothetical protein